MDDTCWFCTDDRGTHTPPGGWVLEDDRWRVWHVPADWGPVGTTVVEARRHFLDHAAMTADEQADIGRVLGAVQAAIHEVVGADRVYLWATMAEHAHFHTWLVPWWATEPLKGPAYLQAAVYGDGCAPEQALETAGRLRTVLAT